MFSLYLTGTSKESKSLKATVGEWYNRKGITEYADADSLTSTVLLTEFRGEYISLLGLKDIIKVFDKLSLGLEARGQKAIGLQSGLVGLATVQE